MTMAEPETEKRNIPRLVPRRSDDRFTVIPVGRKKRLWGDTYVRLLDAPWGRLMILISIAYMMINIIFACLYYLDSEAIENARQGSFLDVFFFSVQTLATIGYGKMAPTGIYANILVTIEAFMGFAFYAMITGLVFSKFSRPTARVLFSEVAVIAPYQGVPHLMIRLANERLNRIIDAKVQVVILRDETTYEGVRMRRFIDLHLVREQVPFMLLTWTVMHRIDENSPLYGATRESLRASASEIIVTLYGVDESLAQNIHARYSYIPEEILFDHNFEDIINRREDRKVEVHYNKFHQTKPYIAPPAPEPKPMPKIEQDGAFADWLKMCNPQGEDVAS